MLKELNSINDAFQLVANEGEQDCFHKHKNNLCNLEKHHYESARLTPQKTGWHFCLKKKKKENNIREGRNVNKAAPFIRSCVI